MGRKIFTALVLCVMFLCPAVGYELTRLEKFEFSLADTARKILNYNKPAFEVKLTKDDRKYTIEGTSRRRLARSLWNRVCAKDKTLVVGAGNNDPANTVPCYFVTEDPELIFVGGIRVGASVKVLEKFFGKSINNMNDYGDDTHILWGTADEDWSDGYRITHENGIITRIETNGWSRDEPITDRTKNFVKKKAAELGISAQWYTEK